MECWGKARERVVKATFVGAGKEGLCPQMQNPRLRRGIFIFVQNNTYFLALAGSCLAGSAVTAGIGTNPAGTPYGATVEGRHTSNALVNACE